MITERTIEELIGWDTSRLESATPEELAKWVGDALLRQDEMLAKLPHKRTITTNTVSQGQPKKQKVDYSVLPPEFAAIAEKAAALLKNTKGGTRL
jgi:hypothetical protein